MLDRLRAGTLRAGGAAVPELRAIGVGHSMGAMMTILQQAAARQHAAHRAAGLLHARSAGVPAAEVRALARRTPRAARAQFANSRAQMFVDAYPVIRPSARGNDDVSAAPAPIRAGVEALKAATDACCRCRRFMSMLPGNVAPEAAQIDVPVFLGLGERDMAGPPHGFRPFSGQPRT